jgi:hypothetical protein
MSDWLLLGVAPTDEMGRQFYAHTMEEWIDIVTYFDRAFLLGRSSESESPLEYLESWEAAFKGRLLEKDLATPRMLRRIKRASWYQPSEAVIESLQRFSLFLQSCGGYVTELGSGKPLECVPERHPSGP